jgi:starch phosphorylase
MVSDYATYGYFPASDRYYQTIENHYQPAKELAHWKQHLFDRWYDIKIETVDISAPADIQVNENIAVKAQIHLAGLKPEDVEVQVYKGPMDADGNIVDGVPMTMEYQGSGANGRSIYTANIAYSSSGLQGLSLRILPQHPYLSSPFQPGLQVIWANS